MRRKYLPDNSRQANSWSQLPALTDSSKSHFKNCYSFWYILSLSFLVQIKNLIPTRGGNWSSNTTCSLRSDTAWNLVKKPNRFHLSMTMALTIKCASVLLVRMTNWASNTNQRKKKEQENTSIVPFRAIFYAHIYLNLISKTDHKHKELSKNATGCSMTSFLPLTLSILALTTKVLTASGVLPKISKVNSFWWNFLYNYLLIEGHNPLRDVWFFWSQLGHEQQDNKKCFSKLHLQNCCPNTNYILVFMQHKSMETCQSNG